MITNLPTTYTEYIFWMAQGFSPEECIAYTEEVLGFKLKDKLVDGLWYIHDELYPEIKKDWTAICVLYPNLEQHGQVTGVDADYIYNYLHLKYTKKVGALFGA